ncbi:MAG TPA: group 1 truncated hemoglobin [Polyangia bacterium]|jgi:hemoglobin|nr:group 1 truncated hemoglobin [Polyangia bacterium]
MIRKTCLLLALFWVGCASSSRQVKSGAGSKSLFERLGGQAAITAVAEDITARIVADNRINQRFANTDIPHFKQELADQLCEISGGPCKYTGKDMRTGHAGMNIADDEFKFLVEDIKATLDKFKVGAREQKELLGLLGGMQKDVVGL